MTVSIHYWRFEDGKTSPNPGSKWAMIPPPKGWYCWAYTSDDFNFEEWMDRCCPTADVTYRFNSGDPMYTVYITDEKEAMLFQLAWVQ